MPHDGHSSSPRRPQTYLVCLMPSSSVNTSFCTKFRRPSLLEFLSAPNPVIGVPTRAVTSWCCFTISNASVKTPLGLRRLGTEGGAEMAGGCMSLLWIAWRGIIVEGVSNGVRRGLNTITGTEVRVTCGTQGDNIITQHTRLCGEMNETMPCLPRHKLFHNKVSARRHETSNTEVHSPLRAGFCLCKVHMDRSEMP